MALHYQLTRKEKPLITFIHGLGEDHSIFNHQTAYLQDQNYSTLTFDLRGHGKSELTKRISIPSHARDLEEILQKENIPKTNLVGFSLGAAVALEYAHKYSEKVNKLCLINPALYQKNFFTYPTRAVNLFSGPLKQLAKFDKNKRKNPPDLSQTRLSTAYFFFLSSLRNTSLAGLHANIEALKEHGVPEYLSKIPTQTLILVGDNDELVRPAASEHIQEQLPNSELTLLPGNHVIMLKNTEEINKRLKEFFE